MSYFIYLLISSRSQIYDIYEIIILEKNIYPNLPDACNYLHLMRREKC